MTIGNKDVRSWLVTLALALAATTSGVALAQTTNRAPLISGTPATTVALGNTYQFTPVASDPDGNAISFSVWNKPAWASFSPSTGYLVGTPGATDVGTYSSIYIYVTDGLTNARIGPFSITVRAAGQNAAPTISGTPATSVTQGSPYAFQPTAGDPDGDPIYFSIWNKPGWASFDASTGRLAGTPGAGNVGTYSNIFITVTDGLLNKVLGPFSITVGTGTSTTQNRTPTISGTPPSSVLVGSQYAFQPTASDPDGNPISFSVWNKPAWATFSTSTGQLAGTPGAGDVGTYSSIYIYVTDGLTNARIGPFSITVQASASGSATLSWQPPTQNTDGSALTNLAGYKVYWGTSQGTYPNSVTLNNPGLASYVVTNLASGTYFFAMTALNAAGAESSKTSPVSKTVP